MKVYCIALTLSADRHIHNIICFNSIGNFTHASNSKKMSAIGFENVQ